MNILIVTTGFPDERNQDFAGKFVGIESLAYARNGAKVKVITPHQPGAKRVEEIEKNLQVIRFLYFLPESLQKLKKPNEPLYKLNSFLSIVQIPIFLLVFVIQILKFAKWADIIHCQWSFTALLALPAKWLLNKKIVLTVRGSDIRLLPKWLNRYVHRQIDAAIDCYGPQKWNEEYKRNFPASFLQLPLINFRKEAKIMPKDMLKPIKSGSEPFIIIFIGRFHEVKFKIHGLPIYTLIESAAILRQMGKDIQVYYLGSGDELIMHNMSELIAKNEVSDIVHILGSKLNLEDYIPFCDIGIGGTAFDSDSQDYSLNKKPQILVFGGDNAETPWKDKVNAIFFHAGEEQSLTDALLFALDNRVKTQQIAINAFNLMSQYVVDVDAGGKIYLDAFHKMLKVNH